MIRRRIRCINCLISAAMVALIVLGVTLGCVLMDRLGTVGAWFVSSLTMIAVAVPPWLLLRRYFDSRPQTEWTYHYQRRRSRESSGRDVAKWNGIILVLAAPLLLLLGLTQTESLGERLAVIVGATICLFGSFAAVCWSQKSLPWHMRHDLNEAIDLAKERDEKVESTAKKGRSAPRTTDTEQPQ